MREIRYLKKKNQKYHNKIKAKNSKINNGFIEWLYIRKKCLKYFIWKRQTKNTKYRNNKREKRQLEWYRKGSRNIKRNLIKFQSK